MGQVPTLPSGAHTDPKLARTKLGFSVIRHSKAIMSIIAYILFLRLDIPQVSQQAVSLSWLLHLLSLCLGECIYVPQYLSWS